MLATKHRDLISRTQVKVGVGHGRAGEVERGAAQVVNGPPV